MSGGGTPLERFLDRLGPIVSRDAPMAPLCTYRVGGAAAGFIEVDDLETLDEIRSALTEGGSEIPVLVVGRGSNLLVADRGFPGLVAQLGEAFEQIEIDTDTARVIAGGAALLPVVARKTAAAICRGD